MTNATLAMFRQIAEGTVPAAKPLEPGALAVFTDYKGREIGCTIQRIAEGQVWCKVAGLSEWQGPYRIGDVIVREVEFVKAAV